LILSPAKNALGKFESKNILNFKGCFSDFINAEEFSVIIVLYNFLDLMPGRSNL
jgi:hypothetical protein